MEREKVLSMTNDFGKEYLQSWHKNDEFLGIERTSSSISRNEFYLVFRYKTDGSVYVCVLPMADSVNNGCCSFGDLEYFATIFAHDKAEIETLWNPIYSRPVYPRWRNDVTDEKKAEFFRIYKEILNKYSVE